MNVQFQGPDGSWYDMGGDGSIKKASGDSDSNKRPFAMPLSFTIVLDKDQLQQILNIMRYPMMTDWHSVN